MKLLLLTFYFEPDLCAGSFRNTALVEAMEPLLEEGDHVDVITTKPNRYSTFEIEAPSHERISDKIDVYRIDIPKHSSGFLDQIWSFKTYYRGVWSHLKRRESFDYDSVYASSSRLFTAFLGARVSNKYNIPLYLDIRDIFTDTIDDVIKNRFIRRLLVLPLQMIEKYTITSASKLNVVSGGFRNYFSNFYQGEIEEYTNGIDDIFLEHDFVNDSNDSSESVTITYAGNIGDGQGLDKIIPEAARRLGEQFQFKIIGDGGKRAILEKELKDRGVSNVELIEPVDRQTLLDYYREADYLFLHLNDYDAFKKVLPSKIFEYAATHKPLIAGVSGYPRTFLENEVDDVILFDPCNVEEFVDKMRAHGGGRSERPDFIERYRRPVIMKKMARSIMDTVA